MRCMMPPQVEQAGPMSRPIRPAGLTGGVSVRASVGGCDEDAAPFLYEAAFEEVADAWPPSVSLPDPLPPLPEGPDSSSALRERTSGVRMPSSSWVSTSRKRDASQRMM